VYQHLLVTAHFSCCS